MSNPAPSLFDYVDLRSYLREYYRWRKSQHSGWSFAVWARSLKLRSPSTLIMIVNGQRNPGPRLLRQMELHFNFDPQECAYFESLAGLQRVQGDVAKSMVAMRTVESLHPDKSFRILDRLHFQSIAHWHYYAIRELVQLKDFRENPEWIARRLGSRIHPAEAAEALKVLIQLGLLERSPKGRLAQTTRHIQTTRDLADLGIKRFHTSCLEKAREALWELEPNARHISGCTFAIRKSHIKTAKTLIREFQRKMCELLENPRGDDVFHLQVAFFPLTRSLEADE
ncbi:MAG: TIGR02147 family protein [Bdellovibrionales bacterium]